MGLPSIGSEKPAWLQRKEDDFRKTMAEHGLAEPSILALVKMCADWRDAPERAKKHRGLMARQESIARLRELAHELSKEIQKMHSPELKELDRELRRASLNASIPFSVEALLCFCLDIEEATNRLIRPVKPGRSESLNYRFVEAIATLILNPAGIATSPSRTSPFMLVLDACFALAGIPSGARAAVEKYVQRTESDAGVQQD